jgi:3-mercaptopropionate dioxygenase
MADKTWLPDSFRQPAPESGMGAGIASWLIYRAGDASLSLFALVVPPGSSTPIHDHLAWGLVGLYIGEQREEVFEADPDARESSERRRLRLSAINELREGDFYELIPPAGDIHRVTTTSDTPSISLHLLGNDTGCVQRHRYDLDSGVVLPFTSGYTNRACDS